MFSDFEVVQFDEEVEEQPIQKREVTPNIALPNDLLQKFQHSQSSIQTEVNRTQQSMHFNSFFMIKTL